MDQKKEECKNCLQHAVSYQIYQRCSYETKPYAHDQKNDSPGEFQVFIRLTKDSPDRIFDVKEKECK